MTIAASCPRFCLVLLAFLALPTWAQPSPLTLQDAVRLVLERQPRLGEDSVELDLSRHQVASLKRSAILPRFEVSVAFGPAPGFKYTRTGDSANPDSSRRYSWLDLGPYFGTELELAQPLNVDRFRSGLSAARAAVRVSKARHEARRQDEVREAIQYWFGLQYANRMISLLNDAVYKMDSAQKVIEDKLEEGDESVTQDDLFQFKTSRWSLDKGMQEAQLGRERARRALVFFLGLGSMDSLVLADSLLEPLPELPGLDTLLGRFAHPDLAQLQAGIEAKRALLEVERAELGPDIFLFGKVSYTKAWVANRNEQNQDVLVTDPINTASGALGLGFRWRLNYWSQTASVRKAELEWVQLRRKESYARRGLELLMTDAWLRYQDLGRRLELARSGMTAAESWLKSVAMQVELDDSRVKELQSPYRSWLDMQTRYWETVHERNLAALEVLRASGLVVSTLLP